VGHALLDAMVSRLPLRRFTKPIVLAFWGSLLVGWALPVPLRGQSRSLGPLASEDGAPLHRLGMTAPAERSDPVADGEVRWSFGLAYSNIFEQDSASTHVLMVDMERLIKTTEVRVGLTDRLEVGGRLTFETTGGGVLDGFVSWWHTRLGAGNANRELFEEGGYEQRLQSESSGTVLDEPRRTLGLEDVRLFTKWRIAGADGARGSLSARASVRIPTARGAHAQERIDGGLSVLGRLSGSRWHGHAMFGVATVRVYSSLDPNLFRDRSYHGLAGVERSLGDRLAAILQYQVSTPTMASFGHRKLDGPSANLVLGMAGRVGEAWRWEASFQEDLPAGTPAPDFTLGLRLSRAW
jgi:hypothetical protein